MSKEAPGTPDNASTENPNENKQVRGRPKKAEVEAKKAGNRGKVGRPKGDAAIMNEYKARMLASPRSRAVLRKVFDAALDDGHKHQAAAWKMIVDRILPTAMFEDEVTNSKGANGVQIKIVTTNGDVAVSGGPTTQDQNETIEDAEYSEVEE